MPAPLDVTGALVANGNKVAPKTWVSCVIDDNDTTKTLTDLLADLLLSFRNATTEAAAEGFKIKLQRGSGTNTVTVTVPRADDSHMGIIGSPMYRRINKLPTDPTDVEKLRRAVIGLQNIEYGQSAIILHTELAYGTDDEWEISPATKTSAGVMSAADKALLNANRLRLGTQALSLASGADTTLTDVFLKPGDKVAFFGGSSMAQGKLTLTVLDSYDDLVDGGIEVNVSRGAPVVLLTVDDSVEPGLYNIQTDNTGQTAVAGKLYIK